MKDYKMPWKMYDQYNLEQLRNKLAKAYVPYQIYYKKYPLHEALMVGTLFPELVKPWPPYYYEEVVKNGGKRDE